MSFKIQTALSFTMIQFLLISVFLVKISNSFELETNSSSENNCISNIKFTPNPSNIIQIHAVNFSPCFYSKEMLRLNGCGIAKGKKSTVQFYFQVPKVYKFDSITVSLSVETGSVKGMRIPFGVGHSAQPCDYPDEFPGLRCPLDEGQNRVYSTHVSIQLGVLLSSMIPKGESLEVFVSFKGIEKYTFNEMDLGTVSGWHLNVLEKKDPNVLKKRLFQRGDQLSDKTCFDKRLMEKVPEITQDFSSRRIKFDRIDSDSDITSLFFVISERHDRRSLGIARMTVTRTESTLDNDGGYKTEETEFDLSKEFSYPCGITETCEFVELGPVENESNIVYRRYMINIPSSIFNEVIEQVARDDAAKSTEIKSFFTTSFLITIRIQGDQKRAHAEITLDPNEFKSFIEAGNTNIVEVPEMAKSKSDRFLRWNYDMADYTTEKLVLSGKSSSSSVRPLFKNNFLFIFAVILSSL